LLTNRKNGLVQLIFNNKYNDTKLIPAIPQDLVHLSDQVVHQTQVIQVVLVIQNLLSVQMDQVDLEVHQGQIHQENHRFQGILCCLFHLGSHQDQEYRWHLKSVTPIVRTTDEELMYRDSKHAKCIGKA